MSSKLLPAALRKQEFDLAAHILVYGLIKASAKQSASPPNLHRARNRYGRKGKSQEKE